MDLSKRHGSIGRNGSYCNILLLTGFCLLQMQPIRAALLTGVLSISGKIPKTSAKSLKIPVKEFVFNACGLQSVTLLKINS